MDRGVLYDAIDDDRAFAELPATLARLVGGRSATLYRFDAAGALTDLRFSYFATESIERILSDPARPLDTWGNAGFASGITGKAIAMDDLLPEAEYRRSGLWNEVFRPAGDDTGHCMGVVHQLDGGTLCAAIQRPFVAGSTKSASGQKQAGIYNAAETKLLDSLIVDLQRVYLTRELINAKERRINGLERLLDAGREGLLLMGEGLKVIEASVPARTILASGIARFVGGRLRFNQPGLEAKVRRAVDDTLSRRSTPQVTFTCRAADGGIVVRLLVLPVISGEGTGCVIRLREDGALLSDAGLWMAQHFGLTPAENSVAEALANGLAPDDIAAMRGVSLTTVRSQVRQALQKTGCETVTRLAILMRSLP